EIILRLLRSRHASEIESDVRCAPFILLRCIVVSVREGARSRLVWRDAIYEPIAHRERCSDHAWWFTLRWAISPSLRARTAYVRAAWRRERDAAGCHIGACDGAVSKEAKRTNEWHSITHHSPS